MLTPHRRPGRPRALLLLAVAVALTVPVSPAAALPVAVPDEAAVPAGPPAARELRPQLGRTSAGRSVDVAGQVDRPSRGAAGGPRTPVRLGHDDTAASGPRLSSGPSLAPAAPIQTGVTGAPAPTQVSFTGLNGADNGTFYDFCGGDPLCIEPPDPWAAVGPSHVIEATNNLVRISTRGGTALDTVSLAGFFGLPDSERVFDPRVLYDQRTGRWLATEVGLTCDPTPTGFLDFAVSSSGDPLASWTVYTFEFPGVLPDYPAIGTSTDKVVLSENEYDLVDICDEISPGYLGARLLVLDWDDLLSPEDNLTGIEFATFGVDPDLFTWRPASTAGLATASSVYAIVGMSTGDPDTLDVGYAGIIGQVTPGSTHAGPASTVSAPSGVVNLTETQGVAEFSTPPQPRQPGSPGTIADAVDLRPTDAILQGNRLVFTSTLGCTPSGDTLLRACARVTELQRPAQAHLAPILAQDLLLAKNGTDTFMPGAGISGNGTLHVAYSRSSTSSGAGTYTAYQRAADPAHFLSPEIRIANGGTVTYEGVRWGDYVGIATDPLDPSSVWVPAQHTASNGSWGTRMVQVQGPGSVYVPLTPDRLLDTRTGNGLSGPFTANVARTWQLAGRRNIPADAVAVTGNLTIVGQTRAGYVSITPVATNSPSTSTINFPVGDVRANNVTIPIGPGGKLSAVYKASGGSTHVVFDVTGYFTGTAAGATFKTISPERLLDTRVGNGLSGKFGANVSRTWQVGGRRGIPAGAVGISGNVTVVNQTAAGYVSLTPAPVADPETSTINFPVGDVRANGFAVPLGSGGTLTAIYKAPTGASTHLVVDVTGYFVNDASGTRFVPLPPGRRMDTRVNTGLAGAFQANTPRNLVVRPHLGVAGNALAVTGNVTVVGQTEAGYVSMTTTSQAAPTTSTINFPLGDVRANGVFAPLSSTGTSWFVYKASSGRTTHVLLDVTGYFR